LSLVLIKVASGHCKAEFVSIRRSF